MSGQPSSPTTSKLVRRVTSWLGVPPYRRTTSNVSARLIPARRPVNATLLRSAELSGSVVAITATVAPLEATHLSTRLPFSRPASAGTRCRGLLFLSIKAGAERIHQIDHTRRGDFPRWFDLLA